jgi:hypothetical protein
VRGLELDKVRAFCAKEINFDVEMILGLRVIYLDMVRVYFVRVL